MAQRRQTRPHTITARQRQTITAQQTTCAHYLTSQIIVQVEEYVSDHLMFVPEYISLLHTAEPAVVIVEPGVAVHIVHVGHVVARMGGTAVVAHDASSR